MTVRFPLSPLVRAPAGQALGSTEHSHGEPPTPALPWDQWLRNKVCEALPAPQLLRRR